MKAFMQVMCTYMQQVEIVNEFQPTHGFVNVGLRLSTLSRRHFSHLSFVTNKTLIDYVPTWS